MDPYHQLSHMWAIALIFFGFRTVSKDSFVDYFLSGLINMSSKFLVELQELGPQRFVHKCFELCGYNMPPWGMLYPHSSELF